MRSRIMTYIRDQEECGATAEEVCEALGYIPTSGGAKMSDLARRGELVDTGFRRRTKKDWKATVYVAREYQQTC